MRFPAGESCDFGVVRAHRAPGHDVQAVSELCPGVHDEAVAQPAQQSARLLLTEDKDFGRLFYASVGSTSGVILIRYPANARGVLARAVLEVLDNLEHLQDLFVVLEPGRIRIGQSRS